MSRKSGRAHRAIHASSSELSAFLGGDFPPFLLRVLRASELDENERTSIWSLFEDNMYDLYSMSSFGWEPTKKKKELFNSLSRFLLVNDLQDKTEVLAFCMFRFEDEEGENTVYCYDIQISSRYHRTGIGTKLMEVLCTIGKAFEMEKLMLSVLKANAKAMAFYRAYGFQVDPDSPSLCLQEDDPSREDYDYEIMSKDLLSL